MKSRLYNTLTKRAGQASAGTWTEKLLILCVFVSMLLPAGASAGTYTIPLRFGLPVITGEEPDCPLKIPGTSHTLQENNWPAIPYRLIIQTLPFGTQVQSISVDTGIRETIILDGPLPFSEGLRLLSRPNDPVPYETFDFDREYPLETVQWRTFGGLDPTTMTHKTWLVIRVFPVQYRDGSRLIFSRNITLAITAAEPPAEFPVFPLNRDSIEPFVVISTETFASVLAPYLTHKTSTGLTPAFHSIESILDTMTGYDDAEKLRNFIRSKVELNGTAFVLLAGDADSLPVRRCMMNYDPLNQQTLPMEAYFSDLYNGDGVYHNWDANGDGNFGDFIDDYSAMDLVPDVFTSRLPASTPEELQAALNNVIAYETLTQPDDDWFNRVLFAAVDTFNEKDHGDTSGIPEGECYAEFLATSVFSDLDIVRIYETNTYPHDAPAHPENVVEYARPGAGFMAFHCHGAPDCMYLTESCFTGVHAGELRNGHKLPVLFGFACSTAAFDNELPDWPYGDTGESMPEYFLLNPDGGAIGYVGATRVAMASGYSHADYRAMSGAVEYHYFRSFDQGMRTPGMMLAAAHLGYIQHVGINNYYDFFTVAEYAQFGDPVVSIGGVRQESALKQVQLRVDETIGDGDTCLEPGETFSLTLELLNTGAPAARVTAVLTTNDPELQIFDNTVEYGDMMRFQKSSPMTPFSIEIDPAATTGRQMIYQVNYFADGVSAGGETVEMFLGSGPWLVLDDWDIIYDSYKNGNADPGDHIMPSLFVRNIGCRYAEHMVLTAGSDSPFLEKCQVNYDGELGDLPPDYCRETGWGMIELVISEDCPHGTEIPVSAAITCDTQHAWDIPFVVTVLDRKGPRMWDYSVEPRSALPEDTILIQTSAYDVSDIDTIHAVITGLVSGEQQVIRLHDDGHSGDGEPYDGVFGAVVRTGPDPDNFIVDLVSLDDRGNQFQIKEAAAFSTIPVQTAPVLLIDTSSDPGACDAVSESLTHLEVTHFTWNSRYRGIPDAQLLNLFQDGTAVWLFGWTNSPDQPMRDVMAAYLDNGGALMVSGWDLARNVSRTGGRDWLRQYFGVEVVNGDTGYYVVEGIPDNPVTGGLSFRLKRKNTTQTFTPDTIRAVDNGETFMRFSELPDAAGAVVMRDAGRRSVFMPFALEGIRTAGEMEEFLVRFLPWMADRPAFIDLQLDLNRTYYRPGDTFSLAATLINPHPEPFDADEYIFLAVGDSYWFWPSWTAFPPYVDKTPVTMEAFETRHQAILEFTWPMVDISGDNILFFGALLDPVSGSLLSAVDSVSFGFGP
jgi:hypothetical protein